MKRASVLLCGIVVSAATGFDVAAAEAIQITRLKDLCLDTILVEARAPKAVLVAAPDGRYAQAVERIQQAIRKRAGAVLPVAKGRTDPEVLLRSRNVVALGNMTTNPFIEKLYCQWYTLLDPRYPGKGGYVVRSLHNPYGTGHNVLLVGGSDDAGVLRAADALSGMLTSADPLKLGWVVKIKLGDGLTPSGRSWRAQGRLAPSGARNKGGEFGWNSISRAGILYYMTGDETYLDEFKALVDPDPKRMPKPLLTSGAFQNPKNPLVETYEYHDHLVECVWDLIEESPLFTGEERLFVTRKLLEHQLWRKPGYGGGPRDDFLKVTPGRHTAYMLLSMYGGSRYFAKYYPNEKWNVRLSSIRKSFRTFIERPKWMTDTLYYMGNHVQYVFDFFSMDGYDEFVESGAARAYMDQLAVLRTGEEIDDSNDSVTPFLLNMAAHMLGDSRYVWVLGQIHAESDLEGFRIGRSFWPPENLAIRPPADTVGKIQVWPPSGDNRTGTRAAASGDERFYMLAYRSGMSKDDDYFQLDGYYGRARTPYHLNTIYKLRMFNGTYLLSGYDNDLDVWYNGTVDLEVPRSAALKKALASGDMAYVKTEVPNMASSKWHRHMLYWKDRFFVVVDRLTASKGGRFTLRSSWQIPGPVQKSGRLPGTVSTAKGVVLRVGTPADMEVGKSKVYVTAGRTLRKNGRCSVGALLYRDIHPNKPSRSLHQLEGEAYLIQGPQGGLVTAGDFRSDAVRVRADYAYVGEECLFLVDARELRLKNRTLLQADEPVSLRWSFVDKRLTVEADRSTRLVVKARGTSLPRVLRKGKHMFEGVLPGPDLSGNIASALQALARKIQDDSKPALEQKASDAPVSATWRPKWKLKLTGAVTHLGLSQSGDAWVACQDKTISKMFRVTGDGTKAATVDCASEVLSLWPARNPAQARAFDVLVGFEDDWVRAYSDRGREVWHFRAEVDPSFKVGNRYKAPWFSDPNKGNRGVYAILVDDLWGKGEEEIVIGRPVTLEFHALDGSLIKRLPTKWGYMMCLAVLKRPGKGRYGRLLLAGRYAANLGMTGVAAGHRTKGDHGFFPIGNTVPECTAMAAWGRHGVRHVVVDDLDGDGTDEVIATYTGHWNELRVWDGGSREPSYKQTPRWMRYFGPAGGGWIHPRHRPGSFMRALVVADLNGDGRKEIIVGMRNGWVRAYDCKGRDIWQRLFEGGVRSMVAGPGGRLVVGLADGGLFLLDGRGETVRAAKMESSVEKIGVDRTSGIAGTVDGTVARFDLR